MHLHLHSNFQKYKSELSDCLQNFNTLGILFGDGKRNKIKTFEIFDQIVNIKSFKVPNFYNKIVYKYIRKSKAKRSYEYANFLISNNIGTPNPIAFAEEFSVLGLKKSYYVSEHLAADLTFRELVEIPNYPNHEIILRQFTKFCFELHQKGIEFLDHSPGNTLIKKRNETEYDFFLVDLNRMNFNIDFDVERRMKNLSKLTPKKEMIAIMSEEYAQLYGKTSGEIFEKMWKYTLEFQDKFHRKKRVKKKIFFWK